MKVNPKWLKTVLALEIKILGWAFLIVNLGEFLLFDNFLDLANFLHFNFPNLDYFWPFNNFLIFSFINFLINLLSSSTPLTHHCQ